MDTGQKTESLVQLVGDIDKGSVVLPEFQRDFVWEIQKTFDLFDSFVRDIFVGSLIYGVPSFEITSRELDKRPRSGKGSRKKLDLHSYSKEEIERLVKVQGFRLLLDGQQRATSIYRALSGVDKVIFVVESESSLSPEIRQIPASQRSLEHVLSEFRGEIVPEKVNIGLDDVYKVLNGKSPREKDKIPLFLNTCKFAHVTEQNAQDTPEFESYLTHLKNLENMLRQEKLIAYYLLDTDEEKFALFFERSNSKGIQLSFIDILAAKLYSGFNLRKKCEEYKDSNPNLPLNREALVRSISYVVSSGKDTGRAYILSKLTYDHFNEYWEEFIDHYKKAYEYIINNKMLVHPDWIPYDNMLIPIIVFLHRLPEKDFSQASDLQLKILDTWFWLAVLSRRYSSAAQTYVLEDAQALESAARGDFSSAASLLQKINPLVNTSDDLLAVNKKYDALYKGILNLVNFSTRGLRNFENGKMFTWSSSIEDHHIYPKGFLSDTRDVNLKEVDESKAVDCVLNRTLIPKITNIRISKKAPSVYLKELREKNSDIESVLRSHLLPENLVNPSYDDYYAFYLMERGDLIVGAIKECVTDKRKQILAEVKV